MCVACCKQSQAKQKQKHQQITKYFSVDNLVDLAVVSPQFAYARNAAFLFPFPFPFFRLICKSWVCSTVCVPFAYTYTHSHSSHVNEQHGDAAQHTRERLLCRFLFDLFINSSCHGGACTSHLRTKTIYYYFILSKRERETIRSDCGIVLIRSDVVVFREREENKEWNRIEIEWPLKWKNETKWAHFFSFFR